MENKVGPKRGSLCVIGQRINEGGTSLSLIIALILAAIVFTIISPNHVFFTMKNFSNILVNSSITAIMAAGCTVAMLLGGMDISQYSIATLSSVTAAVLIQRGVAVPLAVVAMLITAAVAGSVNGFFVSCVKIPAVITTMGTMQIFRGIAYIVTGAQTIMITESSYLSGISATKIEFGAMMYAAVCAGLGGFLLSSQTGAAIPSSGAGSEMSILAGVILGGISLSGGKGKISGSLLGILVIATITNGLTLCNVNSFIQMIVNGSILIAAVFLDLLRNGTYGKKS